MYIAIPGQLPPHFGHDCVMGTWDCEADCPACQDLRDSYYCLGNQNTSVSELAEFVRDYHGHQAYAIRDLAAKDDQLRDELIQLGVTWALPDDENEE